MDDRLNRFRQLEGPRDRSSEAPERTSTSGRIDAVLGPGEKAPAAPPQAPAAAPGEESAEQAGGAGPPGRPALSPEALAAMKGNPAELEAVLLRELERRPMHAGKQISLWRSLMRRSVEEIDGRPLVPIQVAVPLAALLACIAGGGLLLVGFRFWQLLAMAGVVFLLARRR
jgi:hypothetical protein